MKSQGKTRRKLTISAALVAILSLIAAPAWADGDPNPPDPPLSAAPGPGEYTTTSVPFAVPVTFSAAVTVAASYPGDVVAIRYDNPELSGEYSFDSGISASTFEAEFFADYATTPAATALIVRELIPVPPAPSAFATSKRVTSTVHEVIPVETAAFVPAPATFSEQTRSLFEPPAPSVEIATESRMGPATFTGFTDWRVTQADMQIFDYRFGRVDMVFSYWWLGANRPSKTPAGFGLEFGIDMYGTHNFGLRPLCYENAFPQWRDWDYKHRQAASNEGYNWKVIRPDGVTAPSSLGAYADYNDLLDDCNRSSFAIGLRYPGNIQYMNGAYGIIFVIDAKAGNASTSVVGANIQAVSDEGCVIPGMALTDCMGITSGTWPTGAGPKQQLILNSATRGWTAPHLCWLSDYSSDNLGDIADNTAWMCP